MKPGYWRGNYRRCCGSILGRRRNRRSQENKLICILKRNYLLSKEIILQRLRQIKPQLQEKYNLKELALFGSYSRDEQTDNSDIDIMVKMSIPNFKNYVNAYRSLEELFPGVKVQVVSRGAIRPKYFVYVEPDLIYA